MCPAGGVKASGLVRVDDYGFFYSLTPQLRAGLIAYGYMEVLKKPLKEEAFLRKREVEVERGLKVGHEVEHV